MPSNDTAQPGRKLRVLFLCTGNSARSILAEHLLRRIAPHRFETASAGSQPRGTVHPLAVEVLQEVYRIDASEARSKSWRELAGRSFDIVITVCDNARETCPLWPGQPITAHWGMEDPAAAEGSREERLRAFKTAALDLHRRLQLLAELPFEELDPLRLEQLTREIAGR